MRIVKVHTDYTIVSSGLGKNRVIMVRSFRGALLAAQPWGYQFSATAEHCWGRSSSRNELSGPRPASASKGIFLLSCARRRAGKRDYNDDGRLY